MIEHKPVLLNEVVKFFEYLKKRDNPVFADFTVGFGGHSREILKINYSLKLFAIDRDEETLEIAKNNLKDFSERIFFYNIRFSDFDKILENKLDGALLDLGVNLMQLLDDKRGFSFNSESSLDMRMDKNDEISAWYVVNYYPPHELERVFRDYADVRYPKKIVREIIEARKRKKIESGKELSNIINSILKRRGKTNPATKFFQAIRIEVNKEIEELKIFFTKIWSFLKPGARLAVISFHSIEDRIVKNAFKREGVKILTKKPIVPSFEEKKLNPRSRSAKLRVCEWQGI